MYRHDFYNTDNYPYFVQHDGGNWAIWANGAGHLASIPTPKAAKQGCLASHFGDWKYLKSLPHRFKA